MPWRPAIAALTLLFVGPHAQASPASDTAHEASTAEPGCLSIGGPADGLLRHGVALEATDRYTVREGRNWGTPELIAAIQHAFDHVHTRFPGTRPAVVGNLSREKGGKLRPHRSHRSGRDADIGFFFKDQQPTHFRRATRRSLDAARTWTLIEGLLEGGDVEYVFIDYPLQKPLYTYARDVAKYDAEALDVLFQYPRPRGERVGVIRHVRGHRDHIHVRVRAAASVAAGDAWLKAHPDALDPTPKRHTVRRGDNLSRIARKYGVRVADLRKWNRLRTKKARRKLLMPGQTLIVGWQRRAVP